MTTTGILLMAYGTPASSAEIERYYMHIRHGSPPPAELLQELTARYDAIGGLSPLLDISRGQAAALQAELEMPVVLGMKHAAPFIEDGLDQLLRDGVDEIVGLVLAPHYSNMSVGQYESRVRARLASDPRARFRMIQSWHTAPGYLSLMARYVHDALRRIPQDLLRRTEVIFSAHSLPESIIADGDPYPRQLAETARSVAVLTKWPAWKTAWQSAGRTEARWIGPDVLDVLRQMAEGDTKAVVVCPCGFVADHLEVLYDVDIEARALANELGLVMERTASPNTDPIFIAALADIVRDELRRPAGAEACGCNDGCRVLTSMEMALDQGGM